MNALPSLFDAIIERRVENQQNNGSFATRGRFTLTQTIIQFELQSVKVLAEEGC